MSQKSWSGLASSQMTSRALLTSTTGMASRDLDEHGAIKSRDRRLAEGVLYKMQATANTTVLVPADARPRAKEQNYLLPGEDEWEAWVVDAYEGMAVDEIAKKHAVPLRSLLEYLHSPGIVRDTLQMLDRQRHHEAKTKALRMSIELLDAELDSTILDAVGRITKLLEVKLETEKHEDIMSPEERDRHYRDSVFAGAN